MNPISGSTRKRLHKKGKLIEKRTKREIREIKEETEGRRKQLNNLNVISQCFDIQVFGKSSCWEGVSQ